jgi:hypothetical protein
MLSKLQANKELQLAREPCANIIREFVIVVVVEVDVRADDAEVRGRGERTGLRGIQRRRIVVKCNLAGIAKLRVIEYIKGLYAELETKPLGDLCFLGER